MNIDCPNTKLKRILELVNESVYNQVINEVPLDIENLRGRFLDLNNVNLNEVFKECRLEYMQNSLSLLALASYAGKTVDEVSIQGLRETASKKLELHIGECSRCRDYYLERFLEDQMKFYRKLPGFKFSNYEELLKHVDSQYLKLLI